MPTLKYLGVSYDCATAIKGPDYIHLLDKNGAMVAAFDNITNFSSFTLENGGYTSPTPDHDCYLTVTRDDGTFGKGNYKCSDIPTTAADVGARPNTWVPTLSDVVGLIDWFGVGTSIPANADLNNYTTDGKYFCGSGDTSKGLKNCPVSNDNFVMFVFRRTSGNSLTQLIFSLGGGLCIRGTDSKGAFREWQEMTRFSDFKAHKDDKSNPHGVTAEQTGAYALSGATAIPSDADLNSYTNPANYICTSSGIAATLANCPFTSAGFSLHVEHVAGSSGQYVIQELHANINTGTIYRRRYNNGTWADWKKVAMMSDIEALTSVTIRWW